MGLFNRDKKMEANMVCTGANKGIQSIKVLGAGCKSCHEMYENTKKALKNIGMNIEVEYITDMEKIMTYGIISMPGLVVNEKVVSVGKVLKPLDVEKILHNLGRPKVVFVCVHNSCRSQIAEALGKHLASDRFEFYSAGTETKPKINQDAVRIMKELYGIDMELTQYSKTFDKVPVADIVISMGCDVGCPYIGRAFDDNWGLPDPTGQSDEVFKDIIKRIEENILKLKEKNVVIMAK